ncbi:MAG: sigma factor-like helix-turn-helix DNA-binding protein [Oscillospiraceae bacterium]|nr:sigma factor-like helix-turn-helix DNA-binding protein [Oscillospiraceae bacterium]
MSKNLDYAVLLDYYGGLLTDKQKDIMELYYYEDLSLSEIAENEAITRQGVHDAIKRAQQYLDDFEQKLGFVKKIYGCRELVEKMEVRAQSLKEYNIKYMHSISVTEDVNVILECISGTQELLG